MATSTYNNVRLGLLVLAGLLLLIATLYIIGKNDHIFGSNFELRARFSDANGLLAGNNVRFSGMQAGTVKSVKVIDDTTIEAVLLIDDAMKPYIGRNAQASIGTEGLIGNKIVNINPSKTFAGLPAPGDLLPTKQQVSTDQMLQTLNRSNDNIAEITEGLKSTISRINNSAALWELLNERSLPMNVTASLKNIREATDNANALLADLHELSSGIRNGKGSVGALLTDTVFVHNLNAAVQKISQAGDQIAAAGEQAGALATTAKGMIRDSVFSGNLNGSLENIRSGTAAFNQDMLALQHNFLLRGYFRRQEKEANKKRKEDSLKKASVNNILLQ